MTNCPNHGPIDTTDGVCVACANERLLIDALSLPTAEQLRSDLRERVGALTAESERLLQRIVALESEQRDYEQTTARLNGENASLRARLDALMRACRLLRVEVDGGLKRWTLSHHAIVAFDEAVAACAEGEG